MVSDWNWLIKILLKGSCAFMSTTFDHSTQTAGQVWPWNWPLHISLMYISAFLCAFSPGGTDIVSCFMGQNPTVPVYRGEIQTRNLGMAVEAWSPDGETLTISKDFNVLFFLVVKTQDVYSFNWFNWRQLISDAFLVFLHFQLEENRQIWQFERWDELKVFIVLTSRLEINQSKLDWALMS